MGSKLATRTLGSFTLKRQRATTAFPFLLASHTHIMADIYNLKLLLIGDSSVGKSSLLLRFADETWLPEDESSAT
jgi:GTPase SAR1 family protein